MKVYLAKYNADKQLIFTRRRWTLESVDDVILFYSKESKDRFREN